MVSLCQMVSREMLMPSGWAGSVRPFGSLVVGFVQEAKNIRAKDARINKR